MPSPRSPLSDPLPGTQTIAIAPPLPTPIATPGHAAAAVTVGDLVSTLPLQAFTLPSDTTYQALARFFRTYPEAWGVMLIAPDRHLAGGDWPIALVSRQQFNQWRSQRSCWRKGLAQSLADDPALWQTVQTYGQVELHWPLTTVIDRLLIEPQTDGQAGPVVLMTTAGPRLCDRQALFVAYARLTRSQQLALIEPAFEQLQQQQQLILKAIGEGVYGVDLHGRATFVNPAAAQMIGWEPQELIGKSMHHVLHHSRADRSPYPREQCPIYAAFQDGIVHRVSDEVFWRRDGTCFPVEYISTPIRDEQGNLVGAVIAFRDITQRKWAEAILQRTNEELEQRVRDRTLALQEANEQLKELSELRSRVITMVCHEFRNPLNNILLSVSSLGRYDAQLTAEQKGHYLRGIQDNVERMTQMIDAILIIGRVEARGIAVNPSHFDVIPFCRQVLAEITAELGDRQPGATHSQRLHFSSRYKRLMVTLDECLLRSILTNILTNAIRYTPPPGRIQFKVTKQADQVVFQITDQGIGIAPEDLPHIFEPFHRGRNVSNIGGTGLGLNIVKRFVDLQGGRIEISSQLGKGTTFAVSLPLQGHP